MERDKKFDKKLDDREDSSTAGATSSTSDATLSARLLEAFEPHKEFCKIFQDAFALVDAAGRILKHNQMFSQLTGLKAFELRTAPLFFEVLADLTDEGDLRRLLSAPDCQRLDDLPLKQFKKGDELQVIATSFPFLDNSGNLLGHCILLRNVTAEAKLQGKYTERTLESLTDPLTGLFSRRYLDNLLAAPAADDSARGSSSVTVPASTSILMCDIDHFKGVNDSFGHICGDAVLKAVAHEIRKCCRQTDRVARYGGEEFAVFLSDTQIDGASRVAEKIRQAVANLRIPFENQEITTTISIGGTERFNPTESLKDVLSRADECLFKAKSSGRNCSIIARRDGSSLIADSNGTWRPIDIRAA
jgi:diguanylate cyclase (GGDEF)-like protein/PAS domain S-box-containing protein